MNSDLQKNNFQKRSDFWKGFIHFWNQTRSLVKDPVFIALTVIGNSFVFLNAAAFYLLEKGVNDKLQNFMDALWWAFATVTTVGYGDITPITTQGKVHGILLMLGGTAIFLSFTALFSKALIGKEIEDVEFEVRRLEKMVDRLAKDVEKVAFDKDDI